jgi:hypothetical protein
MAMPGNGSGGGGDGGGADDETRKLLLTASKRSTTSAEATKLRPASSWASSTGSGAAPRSQQQQQPKLPTHAAPSNSAFRTYRCVCLLLAGVVALSVLDFMGVWRMGSDRYGGDGQTESGRPPRSFGGFRGGGITSAKKNVTSTDAPTSIVVVITADNKTTDDVANSAEIANATSSSASTSSSADSNKEEAENKDDEDDDDDDDDVKEEEENNEKVDTPDGDTQAEDEDEEGDDYEKDGDDDEDGDDEGDSTDQEGSDAERTIPPAPAHLLYNQTFSNWTVLLSEIPVSPSKFLNEIPQGLRIAFVGDSVMRYQTMNFMYFLLHQGQWFPDDGSIRPDLVAKNDRDHGKSWNSFFNVSSYQLGQSSGNHWCDCYRGVTAANKIFENRYFRDLVNDNYVYFVTKLGPSAARGRWCVANGLTRVCCVRVFLLSTLQLGSSAFLRPRPSSALFWFETVSPLPLLTYFPRIQVAVHRQPVEEAPELRLERRKGQVVVPVGQSNPAALGTAGAETHARGV